MEGINNNKNFVKKAVSEYRLIGVLAIFPEEDPSPKMPPEAAIITVAISNKIME